MLAETLISPHLPAAQPDQSIAQLLGQMQRFNVLHLPVVEGKHCRGLIARMHLEQLNAPEDLLAAHLDELPILQLSVNGKQHFFDIIELMNQHMLSLVPVLDADQHYLGAVSQAEVIRALNQITAAEEPGYIIVLNLKKQDYSLTEIASIVESNHARILSLYMSPGEDPRAVYVNLKISGEASGPVVLSFQRYSYEVAYVFSSAQEAQDTRERYDALMRFLNI
ncbi:MAG: CBS domain-containing protein [Bacteroidetes bacterium]|jgi:acetoin utilization protein AcuB|nr:CBS domain-containing protein [Bacteroidota bacterium]